MEEAKKMRPRDYIRVRGASEHNLKNIDVDIPRNELVVLTGMSGSGKSSLAFDTIYAEGQRRYMESLSSYARMFLGQMEKPNVESIEGLSPAISIDQKSTNRNPRSTVGTVTEIYDYFRLLYARIGIPHCPKCGREIAKQSVDQMVDQIMELGEGTRIQLLAPVVRGRKGEHEKVLDRARRSGYVRVRIDGNLYELTEEIKLEKNIKHNIEIVVDRLVVKEGIERGFAQLMVKLIGYDVSFSLDGLKGDNFRELLFAVFAAESDTFHSEVVSEAVSVKNDGCGMLGAGNACGHAVILNGEDLHAIPLFSDTLLPSGDFLSQGIVISLQEGGALGFLGVEAVNIVIDHAGHGEVRSDVTQRVLDALNPLGRVA